ncbi:MAG: hypothetical protein J7K40_09430 [candidate division Zixibacteria bacterium]|nr:hypothetical protein [candidate division Zixibacteria bacterium]
MITPKAMVDGTNLTDAAVTYYTVGAGTRAVIKKATFVNDDTSSLTVTINLISSGGSATYANRLAKTKTLAAGETWTCYAIENHSLEAGGFISMLASVTAKVGCRISGYEVT